jgi:UPF0042 nucleotide-binding protein
MRIVIVTGLSGSGKSVAVRLLEDIGFYCVDNLPPQFLADVCANLAGEGHPDVAVSVDARSGGSISDLPGIAASLRAAGHDVKLLFLTAATPSLIQRYSETRRIHPVAQRMAAVGPAPTLEESIEQERELLAPLDGLAHVIDTTDLAPATLRSWIRAFVERPRAHVTLTFESFAFKHGIPVAADLVFDVRNLPNPFYDARLRPLTGLDAPVAEYLAASALVPRMIDDICRFIDTWLPSYVEDHRHYLTVAIGCTGGQHRSVYVVEALARRLAERAAVLVRHRELAL